LRNHVVLAAESLQAQERLFVRGGGAREFGREATDIVPTGNGVRVEFTEGNPLEAETAVVAAGPGAAGLLPGLGVDIPLHGVADMWCFEHFDTVSLSVADAPASHEIVIADPGRPFAKAFFEHWDVEPLADGVFRLRVP